MRKYGLACDNLAAADVVTADGRLIHASETENADLLWGLRGGGGNFGIVTQFELDLHPLGPTVYAGPIFYPADAAPDLLRAFRDWAPGAPDDVTALVSLATAPPLPVIPEEWHGKKVAIFIAVSTGPVDEGAGLVAAIRQVAEPIADLLGPMPYQMIQTLLDPLWPKGIHAYFKATNLARLDDDLDRPAVRAYTSRPPARSARSTCIRWAARWPGRRRCDRVRGALDAVRAQRSHGWQDPDGAAAHRDWARAVIEAASDASTGRAYVNFLGDPDEARTSYGKDTYDRLVSLKNRYDPTNVFRLNQNIPPAAA